MKTLLKVGKELVGVFHLDLENKKILKVDVLDGDGLRTLFPGSTDDDFTYIKLEKIMKAYTKAGEDPGVSLEEILEQIKKEGFFYPLRPSLHLFVEEVDV